MTKVRASRYGDVFRISAGDHAGYQPGNDVVCAGISALTQSLLLWCANEPDVVILSQRCNPGDFALEVSGKAAEAPFEAAILGLLGIEQSYPESVRVNQKIFTVQ